MSWFPVIERDHGQQRFLVDDPVKMFRDGNFSAVPIIIGRTKDEFVDIPTSMSLIFASKYFSIKIFRNVAISNN